MLFVPLYNETILPKKISKPPLCAIWPRGYNLSGKVMATCILKSKATALALKRWEETRFPAATSGTRGGKAPTRSDLLDPLHDLPR
jgi:hypothetical protein